MLDILFNIFFAFFMGQWEEYHTGLMNTNNGARLDNAAVCTPTMRLHINSTAP